MTRQCKAVGCSRFHRGELCDGYCLRCYKDLRGEGAVQLDHAESDSTPSSLFGATSPTPDPAVPGFLLPSAVGHKSKSSKKVKKSDQKWICPGCKGDTRLPPPEGVSTNFNSNGKTSRKEEYVRESLDLTTVMCALKTCPAPRYHLACSGLPKGSQIFRNTIVSCSSTNDAATSNKNYEAKTILDHLYSSSEGIWWNLSPEVDAKMRSQQSLRNDDNWPTSIKSYMCPSCDVEGTSRYLFDYFERFHAMKKSFYTEYLGGGNTHTGNRLDRADESVEARTGEAFLWHLMKSNRADYLNKMQAEGRPMDRVIEWNPSEIQLKSMARVLTSLSKELQQQQHERRHKRQKNKFSLDPSYLIGTSIRLFNPVDNSYHSGRILDYKQNAPYQVDQPLSNSKPSASSKTAAAPDIDQLTDEKICNTLYLIRFRDGVDGRKIAVHQWIYLEEHAVTVGGEVCWAKVGNSDDAKAGETNEKSSTDAKLKSGTHHALKSDIMLQAQKEEYRADYRPVQIVFRSMLEMISVQNLNPPEHKKLSATTRREETTKDNSCLNVLAMGFGMAVSHVRLSLSAIGRKTASAAGENEALDPTMRPDVIPLTTNNPSWIDRMLHHANYSDDDVALGLAMACMEKEERRRIRTWRHLPGSHLSRITTPFTNNAPSSGLKNLEGDPKLSNEAVSSPCVVDITMEDSGVPLTKRQRAQVDRSLAFMKENTTLHAFDPRPCFGCKFCGPKVKGVHQDKLCSSCQLIQNDGWSCRYDEVNRKIHFIRKGEVVFHNLRDFLNNTTDFVAANAHKKAGKN